MRIKTFRDTAPFFFLFILLCSGCSIEQPLNNPYDKTEDKQNVLYSSFSERPKHLDPVRSYSSNEYAFIGQIYEPPFQYHYLRRPYELIPLTAAAIPQPQKPAQRVYEIQIRSGIHFQNHPAFAQDASGAYLYHNLTKKEAESIYNLKDFEQTGNRELTAADYIYQIKRMANPQLHCPIFPILASYIEGFMDYAKELGKQLATIREQRKKIAGVSYNQERDEEENPIVLDLDAASLTGVEKVDRYTYRIKLTKKYPQFIYWMAMPFFAPMPWEAEKFYGQAVLLEKQINLNWYPIGTGPYRLEVNNPNKEMVMVKNENFHDERYPIDGFTGAEELGLLKDSGKQLPFIDKVVYKLEKENIPYWTKFLQGYYDTSGITSDSFDQAINISREGDADVSEQMKEQGIRLSKSVRASTSYMGFNMLDDVIGGYTGQSKKLRQAISIAVNYEEYIQIFLNGRGVAAHSPIPQGIFGFIEGEKGVNPYVYNWQADQAARKSLDEAKQLMVEAGYPGGIDENTGEPLLLYFDTAASGPDAKSLLDWLRKQFKKINIQLVIRSTDYNRFQDKMLKGNAQIYQWGWNADYPDPENFLFLLYGPNKKVGGNGENASNYQNPSFDKLFERMANMENSPKRLSLIKEMIAIVQEDAPWLWGLHPISFGLYHEWFQNAYPNLMANNTLKYKTIEPELRYKKRMQWNKPVLWPVLLFATLFIVVLIFPAVKKGRGL